MNNWIAFAAVAWGCFGILLAFFRAIWLWILATFGWLIVIMFAAAVKVLVA